MTDTIFAAATSPGRAAVAVVRLSGPATRDVVRRLSGRLPSARVATLRRLRDAQGDTLDHGLVLWFPAPASYTGEDCAEFHVHGGAAVVSRLLETLAVAGLRLAEPGEFTRRAFQNDQLGLAQAEAVGDLIDAETDAQRRQALAQLDGALSGAQREWRAALTEALAIFAAAVDFADEEVPADVARRAEPILAGLITELNTAADDARRGERVREGYRIALIGAPNAGKSTLLNRLADREAAIVTATPGTTRDIIEVPLHLAGYKAILADTAGLRDSDDEIEAEGVRRARAWATEADLRVWVIDSSASAPASQPDALQPDDICVLSKSDLRPGPATAWARQAGMASGLHVVSVSADDPGQLEALRARLADAVTLSLGAGEIPTATRLRHRELLAAAADELSRARTCVDAPELAAEHVRLAARSLDRITGRIDPEAVLGRIFATFCIGK
ncbi:MAG: tRNA uridine-5-carboxymethylaminomethyl(34) synthesis GTPase MnmE [Phenylobacterium sp.]|uniref:tRNA uridine-5-carboxymethylaminomethyl(34) synthesis GTPase MnmE n=1 Tax=Phenylobacterium sp. TaxID=1871053 RepID=UPI002734B902|nr:tRNA uridine-5-carboxymethylaminomethyl(34) synthesis GTPase MnmE [Phenylobacterium sp.]MDP3174159.1 tRNA uridine-5-carboxymethylaminomethyl(34) synthesis GTPase MnmE [Phenylobacterium sp.]